MPKRMPTSKYFKALMKINIWLEYFPDLTSNEAERMLPLTDLNEDQIPSRSRVKQMIKGLKAVPNRKQLSDRNKRTKEIAMRRSLLEIVAKDSSLKGLRDNSDSSESDIYSEADLRRHKELAKELEDLATSQAEERKKQAEERKKIAGSFHDTLRDGLDPFGKATKRKNTVEIEYDRQKQREEMQRRYPHINFDFNESESEVSLTLQQLIEISEQR